MQNAWLFPYRPFDVAGFLHGIGSPRLQDMPELAEWIARAARRYDLRAEWLLMLAQKEQSAITATSLSEHGRDWLMGYGYTEGPIYARYKGPAEQVFSAAEGLRRYLTKGDSLYVGDRVGKPWRDVEGQTRTINTLAEAAALQYTPHWSTLETIQRIWERWGFEALREPLTVVARSAKRQTWMKESYALRDNRRCYLTTTPGYCAAYAAEILAHAYDPQAGPNARHRQSLFRYLGVGDSANHWAEYLACGGDRDLGAWVPEPAVRELRPGDMLFWRPGVKGYRCADGHVAIVVDRDGGRVLVAENSTSRGIGVHAIDVGALAQVAGLKRWLLPREEIIIVEGLGRTPLHVVRDANARIEGETLRADVRPLLEGLGYRVFADHLDDQRKLYVMRV